MLLRLDENLEIDMGYITCAEYQLFIDDKLNAGQPRQPDHWIKGRFKPGSAKAPITGIRASDAVEFCEWLTVQNVDRDYRFRLPTPTEVKSYPIKQELQMGCWCVRGQEFVVAGVEPQILKTWHSRLASCLAIKLDVIKDARLFEYVTDFDKREININLYREVAKFFDRKSNPELYRDLERIIDKNFFRELDRNDTHHLEVINFDHNFFRFLETVIERDLTRDLDRRRMLESRLFSALNYFFSRNIVRKPDYLLNLNFNIYQDIYQRIESNKATDFQLLYFPLMIIVMICHQLSIIYNQASQNRNLLQQIQFSSSRSEEISLYYADIRDKFFPFYAYLVLLNERQLEKIPAWEGIRIVRQRIY